MVGYELHSWKGTSCAHGRVRVVLMVGYELCSW